MSLGRIEPWDKHNQRLMAQVHPADWQNPTPRGRYNLVVIGGGTAGLVAAAGAAGLGAKVALIERNFLGGDCLNTGCIPSKALIRAARAVAEVRQAGRFGIKVPEGVAVDFAQVMARMRRLRAEISPHDSARRFTDLGVDVFLGHGRFTGPDAIEVVGQTLRFGRAVIATGARAVAPPIPGLETVPYLTNETLFSLTELPRRLGIVGAGPIGSEMAQCFARFGSEVSLVETAHGILPREDREAADRVRSALEADGVQLLCCGRGLRVNRAGPAIQLLVESHGRSINVEVDRLLVATGRQPNIAGLGLEIAGVEFDGKGVKVNERLRTTQPGIYACGDVCSPFQFTHAADFMARIVIQNALFKGRARASDLIIPHVTYTSPELAQVGLTAAEAQAGGIAIDTFTQEFDRIDRAVLDDETNGFVRVHTRRGSDQIVGATIVAAHAGELISELTLAMKGGIGLKTLAAVIHPYPTQAEAIRKTGDAYNRTRLTPLVQRWMRRWLHWQRGG